MRWYISGPMSGHPNFNYPAFHEMAGRLRRRGEEVINPAENFGGSTDHPGGRKAYMREDFKHVLNADGLVMLPGWEKSRGARIEKEIAEELELPILDHTFRPITNQKRQENVLEEANRIVHGARQASYGHPKLDFSRTAKIWSAIIGTEVKPEQVALCMVGVKISRLCNAYNRDSIVDIAGYAATMEMLRE